MEAIYKPVKLNNVENIDKHDRSLILNLYQIMNTGEYNLSRVIK